ncbi:MAG: non-hydrolyzing UDP-N-acetylglucosamine 2-epimerase [Candidatus Micrarchaeia archaeon]
MKVLSVVGARPNFMKIAPIMREMRKHKEFEPVLLHTGQHYDYQMSDVFFKQLQLDEPDYFLGVGSGTQAEQTAKIMLALEPILQKERPEVVLVVGDVTSTFASAFTAFKLGIKVAHVEAGLRSNDWRMPEEGNRVLTDRISKYLFTPSEDAEANLAREGITKGIHFVGNVMIDSLVTALPEARKTNTLSSLGLEEKGFGLVTLHRAENVDDAKNLEKVIKLVEKASEYEEVVFPVHPRTRKKLEETGLIKRVRANKRIRFLEPLGYLEFLELESKAKFVVTDSGGIQEETTFLRVPCLTVRISTERPVTVSVGTNTIVDFDEKLYAKCLEEIAAGTYKKGGVPKYWDGRTAERICKALLK